MEKFISTKRFTLKDKEYENTLYRLEFNEEKQQFHLDRFRHEENTHGWRTISDYCTDLEFKVFEAFINRKRKNKFTVEYLLKSKSELIRFWDILLEYHLDIK